MVLKKKKKAAPKTSRRSVGQTAIEHLYRESEERYRTLVESSPEAIAVLQNGKIAYLNTKGFQIFGAKSGRDIAGMAFLDVIHPDFREAAEERSRRVLESGGAAPPREMKILRLDGKAVDVETLGAPIVYNGRPAILAIIKDITERKQTERKLKEAHEAVLRGRNRLETILNIIPSGVFVAEGGAITLQNEQAGNIFGRSLTDMSTPAERIRKFGLRKPGGEPFTSDELPGMRAFRAGEAVRDVEMTVERPDGGAARILASAVPLRDETGAVVGSVSSVTDITKRKEAEEALHAAYDDMETRVRARTAALSDAVEALKKEIAERERAERELRRANAYNRSLIEASLDPLVTIGPDGKITDANASTEIATGRMRDELIGTDFSEYFTEPERARDGYRQAFREGKVMDYALEIRHRDGRVTPVLYNASLYRDEAGKVIGVFAAARDVTELKETQDRLLATNRIMQLLSQRLTRKEYLEAAVGEIRRWSGCSNVGIRISQEDGCIPFQAYRGYSTKFMESENQLYVVRDQCLCIRVITGVADPQESSRMTPYGSFYCNDTPQFVAGLSEKERARFRGVCTETGYASLAHVPIKYEGFMIGLIHLADERGGRVPLKMVEFIEGLSPVIGEAIHTFDVEEELRRNYEALRQSNELLETMFSNIHVMIAYLDRQFNFIRVNRNFAAADGKKPEDFPGKNHFTLYPDGENEAAFRRVVESGVPYAAYERPFEDAGRPERGVTYRDWSLVPVKDPDGRVSGLILSLIDVSDRKRAEMDRIRLAAAVEATVEAVVVTDARGYIQYVNPAFEQITGYTRHEALGGTLHQLDSGRHDEGFFERMREAVRVDGFWKGRLLNRRKDGSLYYEDCTYSPVRDEAGNVINYVSIKHDVTENLRLASIAEAAATMNSIGYVFSGVRHEIGNPIGSLMIILGLMKKKLGAAPPETLREYVDQALSQVERVEYLLTTLKNFNMYENLKIVNVQAAAFIEKFVPLVSEDLAKKGIALSVDAPAPVWMAADPRALQQALLNVVVNAGDALAGRPEPKIRLRVERAGGMVHVRVTDNGAGIPEDRVKDLFRPFYTTKAQGTGLGLVITKKLLTRMNGMIEIASRRGEGTTVDMSIPEGNRED